jgi:hypothetical protein
MPKLSILIPSRNEPYLKHKEGDTEILWEEDPGIGQRALTNRLAKKSDSQYLMKLDAHCSLSQGFDRKMIEKMEKDLVMLPMLCRLDAKNWNIVPKPFTKKYYFDTNMVFQYVKAEQDKEWGLVETMSLQGSCFLIERENYWKWNICDKSYGSWGFQGSETACKTWFNGGRVVTNTDVFYGHMFRVTDIPYERTKEQIEIARQQAHKLLKHPKMAWLIEKFEYPGDWNPEKVKELCYPQENML